MKHLCTLIALALCPGLTTRADDTVGSINAEGYYVAHLPYTESFDNFGG